MGLLSAVKRRLVGRPISSKHAHHERLPKWMALPVFASDALSSTAYATEEIMHVFGFAGAGGLGLALLGFTFNVAIIISLLIGIVAFSYFQTIQAYPQGGGSYIVARDNIGPRFGQLAAAALMTDYVLTVSVSVSAGVLAIVSLAPSLGPYAVEIGLCAILLLTVANLRGAKESGLLFAIPTYTFVIMMALMIVVGLFKQGAPIPPEVAEATAKLTPDYLKTTAFMMIAFKAFSSGCAALTGIEAISDGAGAFREPTAKNAGQTLAIMAMLLSGLFVGTSFVANKFHIIPFESVQDPKYMTVVAQICQAVFPQNNIFNTGFFGTLQIATALILVLAANTAYADFPRLCSFVARDGFLPRQLAILGDRLVYQNGILVLSIMAALLLVVFKGDTHHLIPLYAVGVFVSFTMSQTGMVFKAKHEKSFSWKTIVSLLGGIISAILAVVLLLSKWSDGAWVVPIVLAFLLVLFFAIRKHYDYLANQLEVEPADVVPQMSTTVLLLVPKLHKGILQAIAYAQALSDDVRAIHVTVNPESLQAVKDQWDRFGDDIPLVILDSPYRSLIDPLINYIDQTLADNPHLVVTVIVPEAVPKHWWQKILHNNVAIGLKFALKARRNVVISNVRYFLT